MNLQGRKYFLSPVCLVPNGRAHLGHVAGPLLKMDVLRRHLRRAGAEVRMISLSDVHESHVLIKAYLERTTPEVIANHFHRLIADDLAALDITYDDFINPLDSAWSDIYKRINCDFLSDIVQAGNAAVRDESLPILADDVETPAAAGSLRPQVSEPIVSGWLKGRCPYCEQPLVGFFCESCGGHFAPSQMCDPAPAYFPGSLRWEGRPSLFLDLDEGAAAIRDHLERINVRRDFIDIAERYLETNGCSIRLTVPSPWGIEVDHHHHNNIAPGSVIFSYSALLIGCHFVAGESYRRMNGTDGNPLDRDSDVTCIISFGIDNAVPFLVGAVGCALGQERYKPIDHVLVNYFYDLDGSKFSTSRGHVIWAGDIVGIGGAESDLVRAYLCRCNPEFGRLSFRADEFLQFHNELGARLAALTAEAQRTAAAASGWDDGVMRYLMIELGLQERFFDPDTFDLAAASSGVERWLRRSPSLVSSPNAAAAWLVGLALLAAPVLPRIAQRIWSGMRLPGEPSLAVLEHGFAGSTVPPANNGHCFRSLSRAELNACLPAALRR